MLSNHTKKVSKFFKKRFEMWTKSAELVLFVCIFNAKYIFLVIKPKIEENSEN